MHQSINQSINIVLVATTDVSGISIAQIAVPSRRRSGVARGADHDTKPACTIDQPSMYTSVMYCAYRRVSFRTRKQRRRTTPVVALYSQTYSVHTLHAYNVLQVAKIARRLRRSLNKSIAFSFLRQLSTCHCPRLLPSAVLLSNRSISAARRSAAQPRSSGVRPTNDGTDRQTDGQTDAGPLHRACCAY